jgi:hypothetical protein
MVRVQSTQSWRRVSQLTSRRMAVLISASRIRCSRGRDKLALGHSVRVALYPAVATGTRRSGGIPNDPDQ